MKPKATHTKMKTGARVLVILRDGSQTTGKFKERKGRFVVLDTETIPTDNMRSMTYLRPKDVQQNRKDKI